MADTTISPLRQRLIDDMTLRNFSSKTHLAYVHGVKILPEFLHRSPDKATADDLRLFRLHLVDRAYIHGVKCFAEFIHCLPDKATTEDLRLDRLEIASGGLSVVAFNRNISGV